MEKFNLAEVAKPSRYVGKEFNAVKKDNLSDLVKIALVFPDLYEMGMSNLGLKVLYKVINDRPDAFADRFFSPDLDMEEKLLQENLLPGGLDSGTPLKDFNIVGFSLQYELSYTNVVRMLQLNQIPLYSEKRTSAHPFIFGGGPCSFNPEPVAPFFDCIVVGDGEEVINEIVDTFKAGMGKELSRSDFLDAFTKIDGVYVPSKFNVNYSDDGRISEISSDDREYRTVKKRTVHDLDNAPGPVKQIVPYASLIHDRVSVEIDRGCTHGCRFCQAGIIHRPVRERSPEKIESLLKETIKNTGYEEISLGSLSSGDYSSIYPLLCKVMDRFSSTRTSVSFPSLRPSTLTPGILEEVSRVRKTGFTIAAEAGSARLRRVINKKITDDEIFEAVSALASSGWSTLKLYFMIGLPTERPEDVEAIASLCREVLRREKRVRKLVVSVSSFVPKSHTPFQLFGQKPRAYLKDAQRLLARLIGRNGKISLKYHDVDMSFMEAVFSRGDRRLAGVIEKAVGLGCSFDGWSDRFKPDKWEEAFRLSGLDMSWYAERKIEEGEILPWGIIETGVSEKFLVKESGAAENEIVTDDCRRGKCNDCGLPVSLCMARVTGGKEEVVKICGVETEARAKEFSGRFRYRVAYKKHKGAELLSHLELSRVFHRAMRRTGLPLRYSAGFHPHPRISFGYALPVGIRSLEEFCDIELCSNIATMHFEEELEKQMPFGIPVVNVSQIPSGAPSVTEETAGFGYSVLISTDKPDCIEEALRVARGKETILVDRKRKGRVVSVNIVPFLGKLKIVRKMNTSLLIDVEIMKDRDRLLKPEEVVGGLLAELYTDIKISIEKTRTIWTKKVGEKCRPKL